MQLFFHRAIVVVTTHPLVCLLSEVSQAIGLKEQFHAHLAAGGNMQFVRNGTK